MKTIDVVENLAVLICVIASCLISFSASESNFIVVFSLFAVSAITLSITTALKKQWAMVRLQLFFVSINIFALIKELI